MAFELPKLPYAMDALAPHISEETLQYHHGKHHKAYVNKLNELIPGTPYEKLSLEEIIKQSEPSIIYNQAAQVWNHTFYWHSLSPNGGGKPTGKLANAIEKNFGSFEEFKQKFTAAALGQFGSGWAWLVMNTDGSLDVEKSDNANNPMNDSQTPILTCDVWEHAYYIDTRNDRAKYVGNFWELVNWEFAAKNFE